MFSRILPIIYIPSLLVFLLFGTGVCFANPGGVGSDLYIWLKADGNVYTAGTTAAVNNQTVATWDNAARSNEATQTTNANKPVYKTGVLNGQPIVFFDGSNDFLNITTNSLKNSNYTLFLVGTRRDDQQNYFFGSPGGTANQSLLFGYYSNTQPMLSQWANDLVLTSGAFNSPAITPFLLSASFDSGSGHELVEDRDGVRRSGTNTNGTGVSGTSGGYIGQGAGTYANGDVAEFIAYSRSLSATDKQKVRSYLALKYGISLRGNEDYVNAAGTVIFDGDGVYSGYANNVAGIGRDTASELSLSSSISQGENAVMAVSSPSSLDAGDFLLWGNNSGALSLSDNDVPSLINSRLSRVWRFHETGDVGTVTISFDISDVTTPNTNNAGDYALLISSVSSFTDVTRVDASSLSGDTLSFTNVSLSSGDRVTIGIKKGRDVSLGGVLEHLRLWLDTDDPAALHTDAACTSSAPSNGNDVRCWKDKSTYGSHVTAISGDCSEGGSGVQTCGVPTYRTNQFGSKPALVFSQTELDALRYDLAGNGEQWTASNFSMFAAFEQVGTTETFQSFFSNGTPPGADHFQIDAVDLGALQRFRVNGIAPKGSEPLFGPVDNSLKLYSVRVTPTLIEVYSEGRLQDSETLSVTLGRIFEHYRINQNRKGERLNNSKMAEFILYDKNLSNCEFAQVNQYLGYKYGRDFGGGIPGGVDCEHIYVWYDGGNELTHSSDAVSAWGDLGPYANTATQATAAAQPGRSAGGMNSNDVLSFDGGDSLNLDGSEMPISSVGRSYYLVVRPTAGADPGAVISHGSNSNGRKVSLGSSPTQVSVDVGGHVYGATRTSTSEVELLTFEFESGNDSNATQIRVNGANQTESTISGNTQTMNTGTASAEIGSEAFTTGTFNGDIGEIFVYGTVLSSADRNRVESYFALKYGVTLDASEDYVNADGDVLYDSNGAKSGYVNNIAGLAHDDSQSLFQTSSKSQTSDAVISISLDSADAMSDGESLVWGSDGGARTEMTSGLPSSVGARLTRIWSFSEVGEIDDVTVSFDLSGLTVTGTTATDFTLIQDSDTSFSSGATLTAASSFSNNVVTFNSVNIDDGDYIALGTAPFTGSLTVSITDASGNDVASPSVSFVDIQRSGGTTTSSGVLGTSTQKITVTNTTNGAGWNLTLAADNTTSLWSDGTNSFDFNDAVADGSDSDSVGGSLTVNPSVSSIVAGSGCNANGLTKGASASFSEGSTDSVTLITAGTSAGTNCSWNITGITLSQQIPGEQKDGSYSLNMVLTVTAQ